MNASSRNTITSRFARALLLCLLALCSNLALAQAPPVVAPSSSAAPTEAQKIQMLIHNIEVMKDARFVRNGSDYDGAAAADHLRLKLRRAGDRIKTAQDFITYLASTSSFSGKPYLIRFSDGHEIESGAYFRAMLAKIEHPAMAPSKPLPAPAAAQPAPPPVAPMSLHKEGPAPLTMTQAPTESQKIQSLVGGMQKIRGARFVRDGRSYSVTQAARYLRLQLRRAGNRVATAEDFITDCAARSTTGQANRIRFSNGRETDAGEYFRARLAIIEHSASAIRPIGATPSPAH